MDVERDRGKKTKAGVVTKAVIGGTFNSFFDQVRHYVRYVAKEQLKYPSFKSYLVVGLACFVVRVLIHMPKPQAVNCYRHIFQSFSSCGWLSRELRNIHIVDYVELVDDDSQIYLNDVGTGPALEDMVSFVSSCREMVRREYTFHVFNPCCQCLGLVLSSMRGVEMGSGWIGTTNVNLSCNNEPLQGYPLSSDPKGNFFTDPVSIDGCLAFLESFCDKVLQIDYNTWIHNNIVDFYDYGKLHSELTKQYKAVKIANDVETLFFLKGPFFIRQKLPE